MNRKEQNVDNTFWKSPLYLFRGDVKTLLSKLRVTSAARDALNLRSHPFTSLFSCFPFRTWDVSDKQKEGKGRKAILYQKQRALCWVCASAELICSLLSYATVIRKNVQQLVSTHKYGLRCRHTVKCLLYKTVRLCARPLSAQCSGHLRSRVV